MTKQPWRTILRSLAVTMVALALSLMMFATASAAPATARPSTTSAASNAGCYVLMVHLNGNSPATSACLLQAKPANGVVPSIATHPCGANLPSPWVALYQDINFGGAQICFVGTGSVNLNNYTLSCILFVCTQWNNQASSFNSGATAKLTTDYNGNGNPCNLGVGSRSNNISAFCGSGWNDAARWLAIFS